MCNSEMTVLCGFERSRYVSRAVKKLVGRLESKALDGRDYNTFTSLVD